VQGPARPITKRARARRGDFEGLGDNDDYMTRISGALWKNLNPKFGKSGDCSVDPKVDLCCNLDWLARSLHVELHITEWIIISAPYAFLHSFLYISHAWAEGLVFCFRCCIPFYRSIYRFARPHVSFPLRLAGRSKEEYTYQNLVSRANTIYHSTIQSYQTPKSALQSAVMSFIKTYIPDSTTSHPMVCSYPNHG
jgi:hypothetical protein